jgi:hypothetical protein
MSLAVCIHLFRLHLLSCGLSAGPLRRNDLEPQVYIQDCNTLGDIRIYSEGIHNYGPVRYQWCWWWTQWHYVRLLLECFCFPLSIVIPPTLHSHSSVTRKWTIGPIEVAVLRDWFTSHHKRMILNERIGFVCIMIIITLPKPQVKWDMPKRQFFRLEFRKYPAWMTTGSGIMENPRPL